MKRFDMGHVIRLMVAAILTAVVLWKSDPAAVWHAIAGAHWPDVYVAVALVVFDRALMACRWLLLLHPLTHHSHPPVRAVMRIFFVSTFVGTFLPVSVGGDAVRSYILTRHDVSPGVSLASVFMDRMLGVLSILLMAVASLFFARNLASDPLIITALVLTGAVCLLTAVAVYSPATAITLHDLLRKLSFKRLTRIGRELLDAIQRYGWYHKDLSIVLAGSVLVQVLRIVQAYFLGRALGIEVPLTTYFAFIPFILLVMLLPITVNGIGTSQAAFVWFFQQAGVARPSAFALSVLFVALGIVGNLPGGILYAMGERDTRQEPAVSS